MEYLTISEIEKKTTDKRSLRKFDFARAVALTNFLKSLESEHRAFRIQDASPVMAINRGGDSTPIFTLGLWARFSVGDGAEYYMEMNRNPLFRANIIKSWRECDKLKRSEYADIDMNDIFYDGIAWNAEPETIAKLEENLHDALNVAKRRNSPTYIKEIPAYDKSGAQNIYFFERREN